MFYIGQEVVCIKSSINGHTIKGKTYIVEGVSACKCGTVLVLKGIFLDLGLRGTTCRPCGTRLEGRNHWHDANRFSPLEEKSFADEIEEMVKKEYELTEAFV